MMDTSYENLANAIIIQAAKDYQKALRQLRRNPNYASAAYTKHEVEQFFRSQWFHFLTNVDPEYLIEELSRADL